MKVTRWEVEAPQWQDRPPLRVGVIADVHLGFRPVGERRLRQAVARLDALAPDIVVFLGDLAGGYKKANRWANMKRAAELLAPLARTCECFAIIGNHDWRDDPSVRGTDGGPTRTVDILSRAGFRVLVNHACRPAALTDVWVAGLDSQRGRVSLGWRGLSITGTDDLDGTLQQIRTDDPVLLLAHEPDIFPEVSDGRVALVLCGHTHAGQVRLFGRAVVAPSRFGTRYAYGRFRAGSAQMIVSGGLGCSTVPLRIGAIPEVSLVEIRGPA